MPSQNARRSRSKSRSKSKAKRRWRPIFWRLVLLALAVFIGFVVYTDIQIRKHFEGKRWALPAHVYARPLDLYPGLPLSAEQFKNKIRQLGYRADQAVDQPGTFREGENAIHVYAREFVYWDGPQPALPLTVRFNNNRVQSVDTDSQTAFPILRLEPRLMGSISPTHHEDRILLRLNEAPADLLAGLMVMEDRKFPSHIGIDVRGLARAFIANIRSGSVVQGGSTLTQQLIKNMYLTHERTLQRKLREMVMALLLELHYDKNEILEAYLNEVFLGQAGKRAIHGFGLASQFFFGRPVSELKLHESALLVGMVRAPSYYDPRRNPEKALQRRNLVLDQMARMDQIEQQAADNAKKQPLNVTGQSDLISVPYVAFTDFARRQLQQDYQEDDLRAEGLSIFTTLDADIQAAAEQALASRLELIEQQKGLDKNVIQGALIAVQVDSGEVVAMVGDRHPGYAGFNRALDAARPVGSLIKPAVYLTALEQPERYTLATVLDDSPLRIEQAGADSWEPQNYDKEYHGNVLLEDALAFSYNVPTVRLGMDVGVDAVLATIRRLGIKRELNPFPSLFLGAADMAPLEMAQMYQTLAANGFRAPLRSILSVTGESGQPLSRYPLNIEQVVKPDAAYLINHALRQAATTGTAELLTQQFGGEQGIAGKTGTTDGYRDSWFAGYAGNLLVVVWIGRDDNQPVGLSGASGAMRVWMDLMQQINLPGSNAIVPANIIEAEIDPHNGLLADQGCESSRVFPFLNDSQPREFSPCATQSIASKLPEAREVREVGSKIGSWFKRLFRSNNGDADPNKKTNRRKPHERPVSEEK